MEPVDVGHDSALRVANSVRSMALASRSLAGAMNGVWNAPPTCRCITRLAPSSRAMAAAVSMASGVPAITAWPGALWLASHTSPEARLQAICTSSSSRPRTAAIVPSRSSAAACMASPRSATSATASPEVEHTRRGQRRVFAELWPAWPAASVPSRVTASRATIDMTNVDSWLLRVSVSSSGVGGEQQAGHVAVGDLGRLRHQLPTRDDRSRPRPCRAVAEPWPGYMKTITGGSP